MTDEYDASLWERIPEGGMLEWGDGPGTQAAVRYRSGYFRILTPKPKREFVVGKWYKPNIPTVWCWRRCIAVEAGLGWLVYRGVAEQWNARNIDWSASPRDEAPE